MGITTVIGGPHITFVPQETMERGRSVDIAVIGEGEDTMIDIATGIEEGKTLQGIKGSLTMMGRKWSSTSRGKCARTLTRSPCLQGT